MKKKSRVVAFLCFMTTFWFGGHRFYLGSKKVGFVYVAIFCALVFLLDGQVPDETDDSLMVLILVWMALIVFDFFWVLVSKKPYEVNPESEKPAAKEAPAAPISPVSSSVSRDVEDETSLMEHSASDATSNEGGHFAENISEPELEPELEPEQQAESEPLPDQGSELELRIEPESEPQPDLPPEADPEPELQPQRQDESESELESKPDLEKPSKVKGEVVSSEGFFADLDAIAQGKEISYAAPVKPELQENDGRKPDSTEPQGVHLESDSSQFDVRVWRRVVYMHDDGGTRFTAFVSDTFKISCVLSGEAIAKIAGELFTEIDVSNYDEDGSITVFFQEGDSNNFALFTELFLGVVPTFSFDDAPNQQLQEMDAKLWKSGYSRETEDGTWYKVIVSNTVKSALPVFGPDHEPLGQFFPLFYGLDTNRYSEYGEIVFLHRSGAQVGSFENLTDIFKTVVD